MAELTRDPNPLLTQLLILRDIIDGGHSSQAITIRYDLSDRTLKRHISELRHLGADLDSERTKDGYVWVCRNPEAVRPRLDRWIELEESRSLVQPTLRFASTN